MEKKKELGRSQILRYLIFFKTLFSKHPQITWGADYLQFWIKPRRQTLSVSQLKKQIHQLVGSTPVWCSPLSAILTPLHLLAFLVEDRLWHPITKTWERESALYPVPLVGKEGWDHLEEQQHP